MEWMMSVIFCQMGEDDVQWTGYYTIYNGCNIGVENYQGVWFEVEQYQQPDSLGTHMGYCATRVA
jgi:hypothetical protein